MSEPADLGVVAARRSSSSAGFRASSWKHGCLARIHERDGTHSFEGDPGSINAWVRVYEEDALEAAARADERLAPRREAAPPSAGSRSASRTSTPSRASR